VSHRHLAASERRSYLCDASARHGVVGGRYGSFDAVKRPTFCLCDYDQVAGERTFAEVGTAERWLRGNPFGFQCQAFLEVRLGPWYVDSAAGKLAATGQ
jgi:hypothetical protein